MTTKKACDLQRGDKIETQDGKVVTVKSVEKGWFPRPVMVHHNGGPDDWSCIGGDTEVELK